MEEVKILLSFSSEEPSLSFDNLTRPNWLEVGTIRITYIYKYNINLPFYHQVSIVSLSMKLVVCAAKTFPLFL